MLVYKKVGFLGPFILLFILCSPILATDFTVVDPYDVHGLEPGTAVQASGVVIAEPGVLGSQIFYINGSQIYSYYKDFPELILGDKIVVKGIISQSRGEKRIKIKTRDDIIILKQGSTIEPVLARVDNINNEMVGQLITVKGLVIEKTGQRIFIDDRGPEVVVYLKKYANIDKSRIQEGGRVEITGIVSRLNDELRILPRNDQDVKILSELGSDNILNINYQYPISITASAGEVIDFHKYKPYFVISSLVLGAIFIILLIIKRIK